MRTKLTIILFLLNIVVFAFIYQKNTQSSDIGHSAFFLPYVNDINFLEISSEISSQMRVFQKNREHWEITDPINWPANEFAIEKIISLIQFIPKEVYFTVKSIQESGQKIEDYGFNDQSMRFIYGNSLKKNTLLIGNPTKIGNKIYLLDEKSQNILVVNKELRDSLLTDIDNLRSNQMFSISPFEIRSLSIKIDSENRNILLEKQENDWKFTAPVQTDADKDKVDTFLAELVHSQIIKFVEKSENSIDYGLNTPFLRLSLQGTNRNQLLLVGNEFDKEGSRYAQFEKNTSIFIISNEIIQKIKNLQNLRDRKILKFNTEDLSFIEISNKDETIVLQKTEKGSWQVIGKSKQNNVSTYSADQKLIKELINELVNLKAVSFPNDAPSVQDLKDFGFENPRRTLHLKADKDYYIDITGVDNEENPVLYAKLKDSPFVFGIEPLVLSTLKLNSLFYRNRILIQQPDNSQITNITLIELATNKKIIDQTLEDKEFFEKLSNDQKKALNELVSQLLKIEVKDYLNVEYSEFFHLDRSTQVKWDYKLIFSVTNKSMEKPQIYELMLTKRLGGSTQFIGVPSLGVIFSCKQEMIDALNLFTLDLH